MTNANVEKKEKENERKNTKKNESYTEVNNYKKTKQRVFTKIILTYGKDVTVSSRLLTTEPVIIAQQLS